MIILQLAGLSTDEVAVRSSRARRERESGLQAAPSDPGRGDGGHHDGGGRLPELGIIDHFVTFQSGPVTIDRALSPAGWNLPAAYIYNTVWRNSSC